MYSPGVLDLSGSHNSSFPSSVGVPQGLSNVSLWVSVSVDGGSFSDDLVRHKSTSIRDIMRNHLIVLVLIYFGSLSILRF